MLHLLGGGDAPPEYVELNLLRIYNCTPDELGVIPLRKIYAHVACIQGEARYRKFKSDHPG